MASSGAANPEQPFARAFHAIYGFLPMVAIVYYLLVAKLCRNHANYRQRNPQRTVQIASWYIPAVFSTFLIDAVVLLYVTFPLTKEHIDADILYTFGSVISWGLLTVHFSGPQTTPWYRLGGFSVIFLFTESCVFAYPRRYTVASRPLSTSLLVVHVFRLSIVAFLVGITVGSQLIPSRCRNGDEESLPLLGDDSSRNNNNRWGGYSTIHDVTTPRAESPNHHCVKPSDELIGLVKFFLPFFWPRHRLLLQLLYTGIGVCLLIERALKICIPLALGTTVHILAHSPGNFPWATILAFVTLCFLDSKAGIPAVRGYMWLPLDRYAYSRISNAAFGNIMSLSSDFHESNDPNGVWDSINRGLSIRYALRTIMFQLIPTLTDGVLSAIVLIMMFGGYMGLITLVAEICILWQITWIAPKQNRTSWQMKYGMDEEQAVFYESVSNWRTVLSFNRVNHAKARFGAAVTSRTGSSLKFFQWLHLESVSVSFIWSCSLLGACLLAVYQVAFENKPFACFVIPVAYWAQLSDPIQAFMTELQTCAYKVFGATELALLLKRMPTVHNQDAAKTLVADQGALEFRSVNFGANEGCSSLSNISFRAGPGRKVAIVGGQGGDKSAIFNLVLRLHDPTHGSITIDGHDIRNVTPESLHASLGIVPRDSVVFSGTIMENIRYANPLFTEEQVYQACEYLGLHHKFLSLPNAYATRVGGKGLELTRGDLQLVAIARVMVKDPKIILVDEATDEMDTTTETLIHMSLKRLCAGRTVISIARRLPTITKADEILILDNGKLVGQGSHNLLFATNRYYRRLLRYLLAMSADVSTYTMNSSDDNRAQQKDFPESRGLRESAGTRPAVQITGGDRIQKKDFAEDRDPQGLAETHSTAPTDNEPPAEQADDYAAIEVSEGIARTLGAATSSPTVILSNGKDLESTTRDNPHGDRSRNTGTAPTRMCAWKPDAPEFVPASQRPVPNGPQAVIGWNAIYNQQGETSDRTERYGARKENVSGMANTLIESEGALRISGYAPKILAGVAQKNHDSAEADVSRQFGAVLEPDTNGVVLMSPRKPRKKKGSSKKHILRRHLTKSEPPGMGLGSFD